MFREHRFMIIISLCRFLCPMSIFNKTLKFSHFKIWIYYELKFKVEEDIRLAKIQKSIEEGFTSSMKENYYKMIIIKIE